MRRKFLSQMATPDTPTRLEPQKKPITESSSEIPVIAMLTLKWRSHKGDQKLQLTLHPYDGH